MDVVFFTIDAGDPQVAPSRAVIAQPRLHSVSPRTKLQAPLRSSKTRPGTVPAYVRLYELAAVLRERRHDAVKRAQEEHFLRESVAMVTQSIHRNHSATDVFDRNYFVKVRTVAEM
jgi:hypothetical protein